MNYNRIKLLSKYRTQLMGLAMLLILIFHTGIDITNINIIRSLKDIGDVGVDIFLLLSGIGLYFSYTKDSDKIHFYKKRILRILPTFIPIAIVWYSTFALIFGGKIEDVLLGVTTLSFWIKGSMTWWFISAILILYIFTPFYIDFFDRNPRKITICTVLVLIILGLLIRFTSLDNIFDYLLVFICRIPIFIIGIYIGYLIFNNKGLLLNNTIIYVFSIISLILSLLIVNPQTIYIPFALKYYTYIPLSFGICLYVSKVLDKFNKNFELLSFLGIYSLEIYLLHEKILWILMFSEKIIVIDKYHIVINIIAYLLSMIAAYLWSNVVSNVIMTILNSKNFNFGIEKHKIKE